MLAELAITATDRAEVIGIAIGLNLLFGIPLEIGIFITAADVFLILWMQTKGVRWIEAFIIVMLGVIAAGLAVLIAMSDPDWAGIIAGFAPSTQIVLNDQMLYLALSLCHRALSDVHRQPGQDGGTCGPALDDGAVRPDRGADHRSEHQPADLGHLRLTCAELSQRRAGAGGLYIAQINARR